MQKKVTGPSTNAANALKRMQEQSKTAEVSAEPTFEQQVERARDVVADVGSDMLLAVGGAYVTKNSVDALHGLYTSGQHEGGSFSAAEFNYMFGVAMGVGMSAAGTVRLVHGLAAHLAKGDD